MRDLPRKLSVEELAELFEGRTALVERLADVEDPLERADEVLAGLTAEEKVEALGAHPAIGARGLSPRSASEQPFLEPFLELFLAAVVSAVLAADFFAAGLASP